MKTLIIITNSSRQIINFFHKSCLAIILLTIISIFSCDKSDENSGKLEVLGKTYSFDYGRYSKMLGHTYGFLDFSSYSPNSFLEIGLINTHGYEVPTGTLKIGSNNSKPGIEAVILTIEEEQISGFCNEEATLKIRKSSYNYPRGCDNYNVTLTGKMRFKGDDTLHDFKLTFKGCL